ncbi:MAG: hypothetical protein CUN55_21210, partial [Phototrophicales bacterium]
HGLVRGNKPKQILIDCPECGHPYTHGHQPHVIESSETKKIFWKCFYCGASGNVWNLFEKLNISPKREFTQKRYMPRPKAPEPEPPSAEWQKTALEVYYKAQKEL